MQSVMEAGELRQIAFCDALTGIRNRRAFEQACGNIKSDGRSALILIDIDHFKAINDTYGHDVGDSVLKSVALAIESSARENLTYRIGGEEFAVIFSSPADDARAVAEHCRAAIERMAFSKQFSVTISAGVAKIGGGETLASAMRRADCALYEAKRTGRNRVIESNSDTSASSQAARLGNLHGVRSLAERR